MTGGYQPAPTGAPLPLRGHPHTTQEETMYRTGMSKLELRAILGAIEEAIDAQQTLASAIDELVGLSANAADSIESAVPEPEEPEEPEDADEASQYEKAMEFYRAAKARREAAEALISMLRDLEDTDEPDEIDGDPDEIDEAYLTLQDICAS